MKILDQLLSLGGRKFMLAVLSLLLLTLWLFASKIDGAQAKEALVYIVAIFVTGNSISKFTPSVNGDNTTKNARPTRKKTEVL